MIKALFVPTNPTQIDYNTPISNKREMRIYGLQKNKTYFIRVEAENYAGTGDQSDPIFLDYHLYNRGQQ